MTILVTLIGAILVLLALRCVFRQLFHPSGTGSISGGLFRRSARRYPSLLAFVGPSTLLGVVSSWFVLLAVGWALAYWPRTPEQFLPGTGLDPSEEGGFMEAPYPSLVALSSLGIGTITPTTECLRVLVALEALVKFGLLTASLT